MLPEKTSEERLARIEKNLDRVAESLVIIARVDERSEETKRDVVEMREDVKDIGRRLGAVEVQIPQLVETRGYVVRGVWAVVGLVATAVVGLVLEGPKLLAAVLGG